MVEIRLKKKLIFKERDIRRCGYMNCRKSQDSKVKRNRGNSSIPLKHLRKFNFVRFELCLAGRNLFENQEVFSRRQFKVDFLSKE